MYRVDLRFHSQEAQKNAISVIQGARRLEKGIQTARSVSQEKSQCTQVSITVKPVTLGACPT
jgi:hypothetical protein